MKTKNNHQSLLVLLCCGMGVVSALLHWLVPTRIMFSNSVPE